MELDGYIGNTVTITCVVSEAVAHGTKVAGKSKMKEHGTGKDAHGYGHITVTTLTLVCDTCEKTS